MSAAGVQAGGEGEGQAVVSVTVKRRWEVRAAALQAAALMYSGLCAVPPETVVALAKQFEEYLVPTADLQRLQ